MPGAAPIPATTLGAVAINSATLKGLVGKGLADFCGLFGDIGDDHNHCAHFVSHVLQFKVPGAALCSNVGGTSYKYEDRAKGFCVRVNEVFNALKKRAMFSEKETSGNYIVVATIADNITDKNEVTIGRMTRKHIGFACDGMIYHFSNTQDKVVEQSFAQFSSHYGKKTILLRADLP